MIKIMKLKNYQIGNEPARRFLVVADSEEGERITDIIRKTYSHPEFIGLVSVSQKEPDNHGYLGTIKNIKEIHFIDICITRYSKYIDVIINRWEEFTGEKAVLLNG
jgi:hypothetical protein